MSRKLVICEINENYLKNVKKQMKKQKMPVPKDDVNITVAHKPLIALDIDSECNCKVCKNLRKKW